MKVVHVIKRIETIDNDIKELKKLEKSVAANKSFSTPIYMSIEKQINILLGERIKLLELQIDTPPKEFQEAIEGKPSEKIKEKSKKASIARKKSVSKAAKKLAETDDDDIPMLTQDQIDAKFAHQSNDDSRKVLDEALETGTIERKDKKVKFFRENFPMDSSH
jgi:hypothetical protein